MTILTFLNLSYFLIYGRNVKIFRQNILNFLNISLTLGIFEVEPLALQVK